MLGIRGFSVDKLVASTDSDSMDWAFEIRAMNAQLNDAYSQSEFV